VTLKRVSNDVVAEVYTGKTETRPKSVRFGRFRPWRWDVTFYRTTAPEHPGVYDGRLHLGGRCGYTFTQRGASLAALKEINTFFDLLKKKSVDVTYSSRPR